MSDTIRAMVEKLGVSRSTFYKARAAGLIEPERNGRWDLRKVKRGILAQSMNRGGQSLRSNGGAPMSAQLAALKTELASEELQLVRAKRMRAQQDLAKNAGELVLMADVLRGWAELMMNFRDAILTMGDQVALRCDLKPARIVAGIIRSAHEAILQSLADGGGRFNGSVAQAVKR